LREAAVVIGDSGEVVLDRSFFKREPFELDLRADRVPVAVLSSIIDALYLILINGVLSKSPPLGPLNESNDLCLSLLKF
jgi:hypothetical protein